MKTQNYEIWRRDSQTLAILIWSRSMAFKLNKILNTYEELPGIENGDEVVLRCNVDDLSKIQGVLNLSSEYILNRVDTELF